MAIEKSMLTDKNTVKVYNDTTQPAKAVEAKTKNKKPKRRDKSDLGPDFVAPDGGWGWVVCLAAGFSNFAIFPPLQQYGFIYKQRFKNLKFNAKQITTIVNIVMAISSLVGLVNGAMFRRFTFRQVALAGSILVFLGVFTSAFCETFVQYIISFSCTYGIGLGLCMAASSLAVNTYFKQKRRRATGFSWTITGLGPIIFPHFSNFVLGYYGIQGAILIYSGIALNAILCACTLQPVLWHTKKPTASDDVEAEKHEKEVLTEKLNGKLMIEPDYECKYCQYQKRSKRSIFSSQYLFNDDDPERPGYEITEPAVPMLARANDGWFGSKMSLASEKGTRYRQKLLRRASIKSREDVEGHHNNEHENHEHQHHQYSRQHSQQQQHKSNYFNREREDRDHYASKASIYTTHLDDFHCTCAEERALLQKLTEEEKREEAEKFKAAEAAEEEAKSKMSFGQKVVRFFDLDLLKDFTFVNLALGITIMMFGEMNFSVLTPFILNTYGYKDDQISLAMSLLGGMDIAVRFIAPFALEKVKLDNRVLFAFGIIAISVARFIVTITDSFPVMLAVFVMIGFGKGFRTIFSPLIIPSYVPLKRLPAASGLQLIFNTIFSLAFGPILGMITDAYSFSVTIHFINFLTTIALLLWLGESVIRRLLNKPAVPMDQ